MTDQLLEEILATEPDEAKVARAVREYREERYHAEQEDKQHICDLLCAALRATRNQQDLKSLTYHSNGSDDQTVTVCYGDSGFGVSVSMDSGIAMIRDILRALR